MIEYPWRYFTLQDLPRAVRALWGGPRGALGVSPACGGGNVPFAPVAERVVVLPRAVRAL